MSDRYALLIGNNKYNDKRIPLLSAPMSDIEALHRALVSPSIGMFHPDNVRLLPNPTAAKAQAAIEELFNDKTSEDVVLLYFSGHADKDIEGNLYFYVKNTDPDLLRSTTISAQWIRDLMNSPETLSERQIVILDCCYAGQFITGMKSPTLGSINLKEIFIEGSGYGRVVMAATSGLQLAWEEKSITGAEHKSVYTSYLVQGLQTGAADKTNKGWVSVREAHEYARDEVKRHFAKTKKNMKPVFHDLKEDGQLILALNPHFNLELITALVHDGRLLTMKLPLGNSLKMDGSELTPLYLAKGENQVEIIIVRKELDGLGVINDIINYRAKVQILQEPFFLKPKLDIASSSINVRYRGAKLIELIDFNNIIPQINFPFTPPSIDVVFILDGTMNGQELAFGTELVEGISKAVAQLGNFTRYGCICYGEYNDYPNRSPKAKKHIFNFEQHVLGLDALDELLYLTKNINKLLNKSNFMLQDYCDALELALWNATQINWAADVRFLITIGNSPPHPTINDYYKYGFFDYTTDEFYDIDWHNMVENLKQQGVNLASACIISEVPIANHYSDFVTQVWCSLDDNKTLNEVTDELSIDDYKASILRRIVSALPVLADDNIGIPIVKQIGLPQFKE